MKRKFMAAFGLAMSVALTASAQGTAADKLTALIVREQAKNVKKSTGTYANNCFTDDDLARFRESGRPKKIVEGLRGDPQFKAVVAALEALPESARSEVIAKARNTAQPTFAMVGFIDTSGKSQTDAGRAAQLEIAKAICDAVQAQLAGSK